MHPAPLASRSPCRQPAVESAVGVLPWTVVRRWLAVPGLLLLVLVGCAPPPRPRAEKTVEVEVTTPITAEVIDYDDFTGRLDASRTVDVRSRVQGYVEDAVFKEGDLVRKGDVLFQIDPRPFKTDLAQAEANLKVAVAERDLQQANADRARRLVGTRAMSREEFDQIVASTEKTTATVAALEATRNRANLFLNFTKVAAPISGRISRRYVDPGNLIKSDETILTTIVSDDVVHAYFDVDERTYLELVGANSPSSAATKLSELKFPVLMRLANEDDFTHPGQVDFIDNKLTGNTGTIRMRAVFPNPRGILKSGLFVRIRLPVGDFYQARLIPDQALQSDQGRKFVYVVNADNNVEYRPVTLGQPVQELRVIRKGLENGDRVIINGMQRVRPNMQVKANPKAPPKRPDFPLGSLLRQKTAAPVTGQKPNGDNNTLPPLPVPEGGAPRGKAAS